MFVSHDKSSNKKRFQKPNILRKNSKFPITKSGVSEGFQPPPVKSLVSTTDLSQNQNYEAGTITKCSYRKPYNSIRKLPQIINLNENKSEKNEIKTSFKTNFNHTNKSQFINSEDNILSSMSFDTFLHSDLSLESSLSFNVDVNSKDSEKEQKSTLDCVTNQKNCNENNGFAIENIYIDKHETVNTMVPLSTVVSLLSDEQNAKVTQLQDSYVDNVNNDNDAVKIKCNVPYCDKEFINNKSMNKHSMNVHNKSGSNKASRHTVFECPVKTSGTNEGVEPCSRVFFVKEELVKHLNEDHTLEQAPHKCGECGRAFFWAAGLRAHTRAHARAAAAAARGSVAGAQLACAWPGCGRAFRQPCRLREHTRAHTGDRPYPCPYPNCGWSFRTASKLERHARRHTGERRHACATCGRAFRRREHLRDHAARCHPPASHSPHAPHSPQSPRATHAPRARRNLACRHTDCTQKFTSRTSLSMHMKKVHQSDESDTTVVGGPDMLVEQLDIHNLSGAGGAGRAEWRAARTHCTWPLPARAALACDDGAYVLEEDAAIEQSEGSESNVFTVRSDLFLHAVYNEDSQSMQSAEQQGESGGGGGAAGPAGGGGGAGAAVGDDAELVLLPPAPLDADLGLHSTIDLMQEQLLYTNPAVDETYRVFLLSED